MKTSNFGAYIRRARISADYNQQEAAAILGVHSQLISNAERGVCALSPKHFKNMSKAYKVPVTDLVETLAADFQNNLLHKINKPLGTARNGRRRAAKA